MSDGAKPAEEDEAVELKPWVKEPERFVPAHDCLRLRFVGGAAGSVAAELAGDGFATEPAANSFTPQYVHQIFDNGAALRPTHHACVNPVYADRLSARVPAPALLPSYPSPSPHLAPDPSPNPNPDQRRSSCHRPRAL